MAQHDLRSERSHSVVLPDVDASTDKRTLAGPVALRRRLRVDIGELSFLQGAFFIYLISMLGVMAYLIPPFMKADEPAHYHRAVSLTNGQFVCPRDDQGYYVSMKQKYADLPNVLHVWDVWIVREAKFDLNWLRADWSDPRFDETTRIYEYCNLPPAGYPVAALGILVAKPFENPLIGLYLARTLGAVVFVAAIILSLRMTPERYRPLIYLYAALPMVLHQVTAISYDVIQLSLYPLLFAFVTKFAVENRPISRGYLVAFLLTILWAINVRLLSYTPLLLLAFAVRPSNIAPTLKSYAYTIGCYSAGAIAITSAFILLYLPRVAGSFNPGGINATSQIRFILGHPLHFISASYRTLDQQGDFLVKQYVAVFGWTDTPAAYYVFFGIAFVAGILIYRVAERDRLHLGAVQIAAILGAVSATVLMLFVSLYAVWSPVGADSVDGLQGRYFVGLVPFAGFGLSQLAGLIGKQRFVRAAVVLGAVILFANVVRTLDLRYYG